MSGFVELLASWTALSLNPARNVFAVFYLAKYVIQFCVWEARSLGISGCHPTMAADDPFRPGSYIIFRRVLTSHGSSRASTTPGWRLVPARAAAVRSDSRTSWRRTARTLESLHRSACYRGISSYRDSEAESLQSFYAFQHAASYRFWRELTTGVGVGFVLVQQLPDHKQHAVGDCDDRLAHPERPAPALEQAIELALFVPYRRPAHCVSTRFSVRFPLAQRLLTETPALSSRPGQRPAHDASFPRLANVLAWGPISATIWNAAVRLIPGAAHNLSIAS